MTDYFKCGSHIPWNVLLGTIALRQLTSNSSNPEVKRQAAGALWILSGWKSTSKPESGVEKKEKTAEGDSADIPPPPPLCPEPEIQRKRPPVPGSTAPVLPPSAPLPSGDLQLSELHSGSI